MMSLGIRGTTCGYRKAWVLFRQIEWTKTGGESNLFQRNILLSNHAPIGQSTGIMDLNKVHDPIYIYCQ